MTKNLKDQAKYDEACEALKALGITPGDFCTMALAVDVATFVNNQTDEDDEVNLGFVIGAFADDGNAYEILEGELQMHGQCSSRLDASRYRLSPCDWLRTTCMDL